MSTNLRGLQCANPYRRVSKQEGDSSIIRHRGEKREGQDGRNDTDGNAKRPRTEESVLLREASGSHQPAAYAV